VGTVEEAIALAKLIQDREPLKYAGIAFYPGHLRQPLADQAEGLAAVGSALERWLAALDKAGVRPTIVSGGSTPTIFQTTQMAGATEIRPGTYVYNDREIVSIGSVAREDCALTVLATVVSTAVPGQAVIDAGTKALGREPLRVGAGQGFGELLDRPEVTVKGMSEEHGILDLSRTSWKPEVGERVRIIPNHVCIVTHLNDFVYGIRDDKVETTWPIVARGRGPVAAL